MEHCSKCRPSLTLVTCQHQTGSFGCFAPGLNLAPPVPACCHKQSHGALEIPTLRCVGPWACSWEAVQPIFLCGGFPHSPIGTLGLTMLPCGSWEGPHCSRGCWTRLRASSAKPDPQISITLNKHGKTQELDPDAFAQTELPAGWGLPG